MPEDAKRCWRAVLRIRLEDFLSVVTPQRVVLVGMQTPVSGVGLKVAKGLSDFVVLCLVGSLQGSLLPSRRLRELKPERH